MSATDNDRRLVYDLWDAQPTNPMLGEIAARVLAVEPEHTGMMVALGSHHYACGRFDDARDWFERALGCNDSNAVPAAKSLRRLELMARSYDRALQHSAFVVEREPEYWHNHLEHGYALAATGDFERGWQVMDDAIAECASVHPEALGTALALQVAHLNDTYAPPARQIPPAEAAVRHDPGNLAVVQVLAWAYMLQYRFDDAETTARRVLRDDPQAGLMQTLVGMIVTLRDIVERGDMSMDALKRMGVIESAWRTLRDQELGLDLPSALAALDAVMPAEVRVALRPGADGSLDAELGDVSAVLTAWHDGQQPGTGQLWGTGTGFRLMSAEEIVALDAAVEADRETYAAWPEDEPSDAVLTDDAGGFLVVVSFDRLVLRMPGSPDIAVAETMPDWIWDRVAAFGGHDPRPKRYPTSQWWD